MGIFNWLKPEEEPSNRTIGEISNDQDDHIVFAIPSKDEGTVRRIMRDNNIKLDRDEDLSDTRAGRRQIEQRNSQENRYRMQKVVDSTEDLEDSFDQENDNSDEERSEQPANGWNPFR